MYRASVIIIALLCFSCKSNTGNIEQFYHSFFSNEMSDSYKNGEGDFEGGFESVLEKGEFYTCLGDSIWVLPPPFVPEDTYFYAFIKKEGVFNVQKMDYTLNNHEKYKTKIKDINQDGKDDFIIETTYWMSGDSILHKKVKGFSYKNGQFIKMDLADEPIKHTSEQKKNI